MSFQRWESIANIISDGYWVISDGNQPSLITYFLVVCTRSDITQIVKAVSRYMTNTDNDHWIVVKQILRYLKGTSNYSLCYEPIGLECVGFIDINFTGNRDRRHSTMGYVFSMTEDAVNQESKLQLVIALSTIEMEYIAAMHACK